MRTYFLVLFLLLAPVCTAEAQVGQIGMSMVELKARLGAPARAERMERDKPWLFRGQDEAWFYRGSRPGMSFAYGIEEGRVASTHTVLSIKNRDEAVRWAERFAAALQGKGWKPGNDDGGRRALFTSAKVFYLDVVPLQEGYGVALSQVLRRDSTDAFGLPLDTLLAFHGEHVATWSRPPSIPEHNVADTRSVATGQAVASLGSDPVAPAAHPSISPAAEEDAAPNAETPAPAGRSTPAPPGSPSASVSVPGPDADGGRVYTWVVASLRSRPAAETLAARYRGEGYSTNVFPGRHEGRAVYRVGIGLFHGLDELKADRDRLPPDVSTDAWPLRIEAEAIAGVQEGHAP